MAKGPGPPQVTDATLDGYRVLRSSPYDPRRRSDYRANARLLAQAAFDPCVHQIGSRLATLPMPSSRHETIPRSSLPIAPSTLRVGHALDQLAGSSLRRKSCQHLDSNRSSTEADARGLRWGRLG